MMKISMRQSTHTWIRRLLKLANRSCLLRCLASVFAFIFLLWIPVAGALAPAARADAPESDVVAHSGVAAPNTAKQPDPPKQDGVSVVPESPPIDRLLESLADVRKDYRQWGLHREQTSKQLSSRQNAPSFGNQNLQNAEHEFLRDGDTFRMECLAPKNERLIYAFDGTIARMRDPFEIRNGPPFKMSAYYTDIYSPRLPHNVLSMSLVTPSLSWIFASETEDELLFGHQGQRPTKVAEDSVGSMGCFKLTWAVILEEIGNRWVLCEIWLAKERGLLPVRQVYRFPVSEDFMEVQEIEITEFQQASHGYDQPIWFPKTLVGVKDDGVRNVELTSSFVVHGLFSNQERFSNIPPLVAEHSQPDQIKIGKYLAESVLTKLPPYSTSQVALALGDRLLYLTTGLGIFLGVIAIVIALLSLTRLGKIVRAFFIQHQWVVAIMGGAATLGMAKLASIPSGWMTYGLTMMVVGVFGILWLFFAQAVFGDIKVSIKTVLFLAAFTALFFGGYTRGVRRMAVRERMIDEVRSDGGRVLIGRWRMDEEGLLLPLAMQQLLGEAWSGRVNRVSLDKDQFQPERIREWCLEETHWLGLADDQNEPFIVDSNALNAIGPAVELWTVQVQGGRFDSDGYRELSKFNHLVDLHLNCDGKPLPAEIALLTELERIWLTAPLVSDELFSTLANVKSLAIITLIEPQFASCSDEVNDVQWERLEIVHAMLEPDSMRALGNIPTDMLLRDCRFKLPAGVSVPLQQTKRFALRNCDLTDAELGDFVAASNLRAVGFKETNITVDGVEAFSKRFPEIAIVME